MRLLKCRTCGGTEFRPLQDRKDLVKCTYCGSLYKLDSKGNIETEKVLYSIPNFLKIILVFGVISALTGIVNLICSSFENSNPKEKTYTSKSISTEQLKEDVQKAEGEILEIYEYEMGADAYYIVGFYKNTGKIRLHQPKIEVNFYNENDQLVDTVNGFGYKYFLEPEETTSFYVITKKQNKIFRKEIKHYPEAMRYVQKRAKIEIIESKFIKDTWTSYVIGRLKNIGESKAKLVSVNGVFFDKEKKIVAQSFAYINEKILDSNQIAIFKISVFGNKPIVDYWLETWGYEIE